jgi:SAM-dependent methyltransferase
VSTQPTGTEAMAANRALWDEWTDLHVGSEFYDVAAFRQGGSRLRDFEQELIGDVRGLEVLHVQCHFGLDTLSFARLGARPTGADFSPKAIAAARSLAAELGLDARFVESNVYDLPSNLDGDFDLVYTSGGVLGWLPDIRRWAEVVAHFVRPGGRFVIAEIHPIANAFENEGVELGELRLAYPYWEHPEPMVFQVQGSYADPSASVTTTAEYGWDHGLGQIVTALTDAGLRIEALREYPFCLWTLGYTVQSADGYWRLPGDLDGKLPLFFSIVATKPAVAAGAG